MIVSACETGLGKFVNGDGVTGLPYALYVAGNKNLMLTLWSIADESTKEFIVTFFKMIKEGRSHVNALSETKRRFLNSSKFARPFFWAPFVLYGY